jgi:DNA-binding GntR family transcriptional regulator
VLALCFGCITSFKRLREKTVATNFIEPTPIGLVKESVATALRQAIVDGRLKPGERVVEGKWAMELGAAQASIREAINLLVAEGFLVKDAGRSARVVQYGEQDIACIYEVRAAIEGLAAQLACANKADLSPLKAAHEGMSGAAARGDMKALLQADLKFHLALTEASGNPLLADIARKMLLPLFAFIEIRVLSIGLGPEAWTTDLMYHEWVLRVIREGNPSLANQTVQQCMQRFAQSAYDVWEDVGGSPETQRPVAKASEHKRRHG